MAVPTDLLTNVAQLCVVVRDLKAAMDRYREVMGVGPFAVLTVDTNDLPGVTFRGQPADYGIRVAFGRLGPVDLELIQCVRGKSSYQEFFDKHGEGVHHVGIKPPDYGAAYAEMLRRGFKHLQGGPIPGKNRVGRFDYFETDGALGLVYEILDFPEQPADPDEIYPSAG